MLTLQTSFKKPFARGGRSKNPFVEVTVNSKEEKILRPKRPRIRPQDSCMVQIM
jgi:hypothetical protein